MATLGEKLRIAREKANLKQSDVSKITEISNKAISRYETDYSSPTPDTLKVLAKLYNVDINWLLDYSIPVSNVTFIKGWKEIPVYEKISCGEGCFAEDRIIDYIAVPSEIVRDAKCFAVNAEGNSMVNFGISNGDILVFKSDSDINNNDIIAVCLEDEDIALCKKVKLLDEGLLLIPGNDDYSTVLITKDKNFRILGKLVFSLKRY